MSASTVHEPGRELPVIERCEVAVFGGGPAGLCAAAAAARAGKRTVLVERYGYLGGMATAGDVTILHSLYGMDRQTQVIRGLAEEFIRRLQQMDAAAAREPIGEAGSWVIDTEYAKLVADDMAVGSGVKLWLHTYLAGVLREGDRIAAALVENKDGRGAIIADTYIDCTGDADLVRRAGVPTQLGNAEGKCQAPTLCFRVGGRQEQAASLGELGRLLFATPMKYPFPPETPDPEGLQTTPGYSCFLWGTRGLFDPSEELLAGTRMLNVNCADAAQFSHAEIEGRYQVRWVMEQMSKLKGRGRSHLTDIAAQVGVRETHRIFARHQLTREEVLRGVDFEDSIARGTYPIDIHRPDGPGILFEYLDGTWRRIHGDGTTEEGRWDGASADAPKRTTLCYHIPFRSLIPRDLDNVLVAGRCIGAEHDSAGAIRVMINCMQTGEAAGAGAALLSPGQGTCDVDIARLKAHLAES
jgi:hypothetical protein